MNKIIVSIALAVILVIGINKITSVIYSVDKPEKSSYQVASVTTSTVNESAEVETEVETETTEEE